MTSLRAAGLHGLLGAWLVAVSTVGCSRDAVEVRGEGAPRRDNILILIADDLGVDGIGVYGEAAHPPPTPNIDALAARGVLFRDAWANPVCSATRAAIMTGRYSLRTGIGTARAVWSPALDLAETTIPEAFDAVGSPYRHAIIGKWHLSSGHLAPGKAGWGHVIEGPPTVAKNYYNWPRSVNGRRKRSRTYVTTQLVDDTLAWIGRQNGPWLCYLSFYAPHGPFWEPPSHLHTQDLSGIEPQEHSLAYFKPMVEALDTEIGRLLEGIGAELEHTNVVFMGDNGTPNIVIEYPFVERHSKGTPYEGGVNVPLIVAGPAVESPGREVHALVSAVDLFSTALDLGGVDMAAALDPQVPIDSVSFVPYLRDPEQVPLRTMAFAERFESSRWKEMNEIGFATVRERRFKLIRYFERTPRRQLGEPGPPGDELYDLENDPWEEHDLLFGTGGVLAGRGGGGVVALTAEQRRAYKALSAEIRRLRGSATFGAELPG